MQLLTGYQSADPELKRFTLYDVPHGPTVLVENGVIVTAACNGLSERAREMVQAYKSFRPQPFSYQFDGIAVEDHFGCRKCGAKTLRRSAKDARLKDVLRHFTGCTGSFFDMPMVQLPQDDKDILPFLIKIGHFGQMRFQSLVKNTFFCVDDREQGLEPDLPAPPTDAPCVGDFVDAVHGAPDCAVASDRGLRDASPWLSDGGFVEFFQHETGHMFAQNFVSMRNARMSSEVADVQYSLLCQWLDAWYEANLALYARQTSHCRLNIAQAVGITSGMKWSMLDKASRKEYFAVTAKLYLWLVQLDYTLLPEGYRMPTPEVLSAIGKLKDCLDANVERVGRNFCVKQESSPLPEGFDALYAIHNWAMEDQASSSWRLPFNVHFHSLVFVWASLYMATKDFDSVREGHEWRGVLAKLCWTLVVVTFINKRLAIEHECYTTSEANAIVYEHLSTIVKDGALGYLLAMQSEASKLQQEQCGNTAIKVLPQQRLLINEDEVDFVDIKSQLKANLVELKGALWDEICPVPFAVALHESPLSRYANDTPSRRPIKERTCLCTDEPGWLGRMNTRYVQVEDKATGRCLLSNAHTKAGARLYSDKKLYLDPKKCVEVLGKVARWKRKLFALLFWSSGAPLRASEWAEVSFFDTPTFLRNVYVDCEGPYECVKIRTHYSKMTSRQGAKANTRFLCPELSEVMVLYLKYIYPWVQMVKWAAAPKEQDVHESLQLSRKLFHSKGERVWTSTQFTRALLEAGSTNYRQSRQLLVWVIQERLHGAIPSDLDLGDDDEDDGMIEDSMANHSTSVREHHYARASSLTFSETNAQEMAARKLCNKVANWCWYSPGLDNNSVFSLHTSSSVPVPTHDCWSMNEVFSLNARLREQMRSLLNNDEAEFASTKQQEACRAVVNHPTDHILYIAPTGRGKSMSFVLPPLVVENLVMIVLCPLISLKETQAAKFEKSKACVGHDMNDKGGQLYFFTYEEFTAGDAGRFFTECLIRNGKEVRIVWDEFHMLKSENYRDFNACLGMPSWPNVKILFLSASVTAWTMEWLYEMVDTTRLLVFAEDTERVNISYCFEPTGTPLVDIMTDENLGYDSEGKVRKGIVFWKRRGSAKKIREFVKKIPNPELRKACVWYWSARNNPESAQDVQENLRRFIQDPQVKWLITTPALSAGVDLKVGCTIHVGAVRGITEFYQESGRCGRWPVRQLGTYESAGELASVCCKSIVVCDRPDTTVYEGVVDAWQQQDLDAFQRMVDANTRKQCVRAAMREAWIETPRRTCAQLSAHVCQACIQREAGSQDVASAKRVKTAVAQVQRVKWALNRLEFRCIVCRKDHAAAECPEFCRQHGIMLAEMEQQLTIARGLLQNYQGRCGQCLLPQFPMACELDETGQCPSAKELASTLLNVVLMLDKEGVPLTSEMFEYVTRGRSFVSLPALYWFISEDIY